MSVQKLAHAKFGEDTNNCGILVREANEMLKHYGYGNENYYHQE